VTVHDLKSWPHFFRALQGGYKPFEVRRNDRDYKTGDYLRLREWDPLSERFTGQELVVRVVTVYDLTPIGCPGYVAMALRPDSEAVRELWRTVL